MSCECLGPLGVNFDDVLDDFVCLLALRKVGKEMGLFFWALSLYRSLVPWSQKVSQQSLAQFVRPPKECRRCQLLE